MITVTAFQPEGLADGELWVEDSGDAEYLDGICAQYAIKAVGPNGIDDTLAFCFDRQQAVLLAAAPELRGAVNHLIVCAICAEDGLGACKEGSNILALMASLEPKP